MGCDGGTIPKRDELVRQKKKPEKKERKDVLAAKWKHCALSQEPLRKPIVACEMGKLYNKDKIIELLLDRTKFEDPAKVEHIRGLKDIKELQLSENPAYKEGDKKAESYVEQACQFICPITGIEMNGVYRFQFLWKCGCAFSERALKEVKAATCNKCGAAMSDRVTINTEDEEEEKTMRQAMTERRLAAKMEKKNKKKKAAEAAGSDSAQDGATSAKQVRFDTEKPSTSGNNSTAEKHGGINGKFPTSKSDTASKIANGASKDKVANGKVDKKYKSVQQDPKYSKAFKSLFSSSKEAQSKGSAHWVTHNPFYN